MIEFVGLIKVNVVKGTNLAIRDVLSSDPYVILSMGEQVSSIILFFCSMICFNGRKMIFCYSFLGHCLLLQSVKTRVIKNNLNPVWNEQLMLSIPDDVPPLRLVSSLKMEAFLFLKTVEYLTQSLFPKNVIFLTALKFYSLYNLSKVRPIVLNKYRFRKLLW